MDREDGATAAGRDARRPSAGWLSITAAAVVVVAAATGLTAVLTRTSHPRAPVGPAEPCASAAPGRSTAAPDRLGSWPYRLLEPGTFGTVAADGPGAVVALQACGAEETSLRVVRVALEAHPGGRPAARITAAGARSRAALLTSSLAVDSGWLWLGLARLDLAGPPRSQPYELTLEQLDPVSLAVVRTVALGRGDSLELSPLPSGAVLASTGHDLIEAGAGPTRISLRRVAAFTGVVQHLAIAPSGGDAVVGLIRAGLAGPAASPSLETVDLRTGAVMAERWLPTGSDPESVAVAGGAVLAAVSDGVETTVERYGLPRLGTAPTDATTALGTLRLDVVGPTVFEIGPTLLECASPASGTALATSGAGGGPPPGVAQVLGPASGGVLAVTASGLGQVRVPAGCGL